MKRHLILTMWLCGVLMIGVASSCIAAEERIITLNQAIQMALETDLDVQNAANDLEKAKLATQQEKLKTLPKATFDGQIQKDAGSGDESTGYQVVLQQTIPTGYQFYGQKVASGIELARWEETVAENKLKMVRAEAAYKTYQYYLDILRYQQVVEAQKQAVEVHTKSLNLANQQLELGKITKPSQLRIENYLNKAKYDLEKAQSDLELAITRLGQQIGQELTGYHFAPLDLEPVTVDLDLDVLQQQALEKRLEIKNLDITLAKNNQTKLAAMNEKLPSVTLGYSDRRDSQSYGVEYDFLSGDLSWSAARKDDSYNRSVVSGGNSERFGDDKQYFTLEMSWTLDFGIASNKTKQSEYTIANTTLELEKTKRSIAVEVKQAYNNYLLAVRENEVNQKALAFYDKDLEIKNLQAKMGMISEVDLAEARQDAFEARIAALKSSYNVYLAYQQLKKTGGELY
ncbi:MAG TPA: TolC family protein [Bacillota bacterium]|nr:TolC family protein [Bacillota bacterium]HOL09668.1 TolC family protein [Bacillota bacterium]HPO97520.1 TolC family protein [Bacillota bacterium]